MDDVDRLAVLVTALGQHNTDLVEATSAGDSDRAAQLLHEIEALERRRNRLVHRTNAEIGAGEYQTSFPLRDRIIQTLALGGRAMAAKLLADVSRAYFGEPIQTTALSSLRRDERRRYETAQGDRGRDGRDEYVVAALTFDRFTPVRGTLALSSWPIEHRLIAPSSPRVDILYITIALADQLGLAVDGPAATRLILRLARTIPGALAGSGISSVGTGRTLDVAQVSAAAKEELAELTERDEREREESAARVELLGHEVAMFGATGPRVVDSAARIAR
jgi:hypothetical protein